MTDYTLRQEFLAKLSEMRAERMEKDEDDDIHGHMPEDVVDDVIAVYPEFTRLGREELERSVNDWMTEVSHVEYPHNSPGR